MQMKPILKTSLVLSLSLVLSGCAGFSGLFQRAEEPPVIYRTEFRPVSIPSQFFDGCPDYVNPPVSVTDGIDNENDERELGLWMTINEQNYGLCENTIEGAEQENTAITNSINELNERLEETAIQSKDQ